MDGKINLIPTGRLPILAEEKREDTLFAEDGLMEGLIQGLCEASAVKVQAA